nr:putative ribonuclease H-like domain-containing protein [Tanacetum cinerariifolium]
MASASPICLMARATPTMSWLWHQRLSHLNFDTINDLAKNDLVSGLPKFKYAKEHLCPSCEQGKSKRASHLPKPVPNLKHRLHLLHMDLCGPMRVASINDKWYVLVIVDDYSRYTWVHFLKTEDETPEVIKNFLKKISVRLQALVIIIRTDNGTEFKNHVLKEYFDSVGITHETFAAKNPQQNGVVERRNHTLVEAARTISRFGLQSMTSGRISSELELTYAPSTITPQRPSERDLDILFEPLHNEYLGGRSSTVPRAIPATPVVQILQAPTASMSFQDSAPVPLNSLNTPVSSHNVDVPSQQHARQQRNHTPPPTASAVDNQVIGEPSRPVLTRSQLKTDGDMCIYALTISIMKPKTVKEALTDPAWIESIQEKLHQFIRLDVYVDEIIFGSTNPRYATLFSDLMKSLFEMPMMEEMTFFLCLHVNQSPSGVFINQSNYVNKILNKYGLNTCDIIGTLMDIKDKLDLNQIRTPVDATKYHSMIGVIMYLTSSRPNIVHATCDSVFELTGSLDVDYAGCKDTFKSTF